MVWYRDMLDEEVQVKSIDSMDDFGDETYLDERTYLCRILDREDFIETMTGERQQYKHLIISDKPFIIGDLVKLRGEGPWIRVKKVFQETEPWGKRNKTWRAYA